MSLRPTIVCINKIMVATKKYIRSACKNCGLLPFDPSKLEKLAGITYNIETGRVEQKPIPKNKPNSLFKTGGVATRPEVRKYLDEGVWEENKVEEDDEYESEDEMNE